MSGLLHPLITVECYTKDQYVCVYGIMIVKFLYPNRTLSISLLKVKHLKKNSKPQFVCLSDRCLITAFKI